MSAYFDEIAAKQAARRAKAAREAAALATALRLYSEKDTGLASIVGRKATPVDSVIDDVAEHAPERAAGRNAAPGHNRRGDIARAFRRARRFAIGIAKQGEHEAAKRADFGFERLEAVSGQGAISGCGMHSSAPAVQAGKQAIPTPAPAHRLCGGAK